MLNFFKQFCKHPTLIGALAPSSDALAKMMIKPIDFAKTKMIVEYGPGTGVFTKHILSAINNKTKFFAIELNDSMQQAFRQNLPDTLLYKDSASNVLKYLQENGESKADAIISGLPWAAFSDELQNSILQATLDALREGGDFCTFAYLQGLVMPAGLRFNKKLKRHFSVVKKSPVVWGNLPPALVYWCKK